MPPSLKPSLDDPSLSDRSKRQHARRVAARWIKRGLIGLGALGVVAALARALAPQPIEVDVGAARRLDLAVYVEEDGRTRVHDRYVVAAPVTAELARIELEPGDA